jgi:hypothetical protein
MKKEVLNVKILIYVQIEEEWQIRMSKLFAVLSAMIWSFGLKKGSNYVTQVRGMICALIKNTPEQEKETRLEFSGCKSKCTLHEGT